MCSVYISFIKKKKKKIYFTFKIMLWRSSSIDNKQTMMNCKLRETRDCGDQFHFHCKYRMEQMFARNFNTVVAEGRKSNPHL